VSNLEILLDPATHWVAMVACLIAGAAFWLFDDFIAERTDIEREVDNAPFPDYEAERSGRDERRETYAKTARGAGKGLLVLAAALGVLMAIRLLF
jgi:hypothetical protein